MSIPVGMWRADAVKWSEIMDLVNAEAQNRGFAPGDFAGVITVFEDIWDLLENDAIRSQQVLHERHNDLNRQLADAQTGLDDIQTQIDALAPDPGPAVR